MPQVFRMGEARSADIMKQWLSYFGEIRYFC